MNRFKNALWGAVLLGLLNICTGCAQETSGSPVKTDTPRSRFEDHMEISIAFPDIDKNIITAKEDPILNRIETMFNITIKPMQINWSDYRDKAQLWAASGQMPDIMFNDAIGTYVYSKWISQGLLRPLPTDMSRYPNLNKLIKQNNFEAYQREGKLWSLPRLLSTSYQLPGDRTLFVRKDWMSKLGLQDPQTYDQLFEMLKAFTDKDPDGDGKNDTTGIANGFLPDLFLNLDPIGTYWTKEAGKWKPGYDTSHYIDVLTALRKLYTSGVLDKDFALPNQDPIINFAQGKVGAFMYQSKNIKNIKSIWEKYNKDIKFTDAVKILLLPAGPDGTRYNPTYSKFWSESYFNARMNDRKMDRILQLYDYLASPEGQMLTYYGFENKDYRMVGNKVEILRSKDSEGNPLPLDTMYPSVDTLEFLPSWIMNAPPEDASHSGVDNEVFRMKTEYEDWMLKNAATVPVRWDIEAYSSPAKDNLPDSTFLWDNTVKVMLGSRDVKTMWEDVIREYNQKGLQQAIEDVNEHFK